MLLAYPKIISNNGDYFKKKYPNTEIISKCRLVDEKDKRGRKTDCDVEPLFPKIL